MCDWKNGKLGDEQWILSTSGPAFIFQSFAVIADNLNKTKREPEREREYVKGKAKGSVGKNKNRSL